MIMDDHTYTRAKEVVKEDAMEVAMEVTVEGSLSPFQEPESPERSGRPVQSPIEVYTIENELSNDQEELATIMPRTLVEVLEEMERERDDTKDFLKCLKPKFSELRYDEILRQPFLIGKKSATDRLTAFTPFKAEKINRSALQMFDGFESAFNSSPC
ncbi:hypothetical protein CDAR_25991 [Caerostris darwini]|uniref:Reverse transcriptase domain-containing protein n=1 Tax=Caerostris darwini TaxID=1538125 RepID=A0AAV4PG61_9ARAC|nr:hypothetical protein CDAR_25991 [Caerostris darwini]